MDTRLLDIFERGTDANLGQTLIRLAKLAGSAHRMEVVQQMLGDAVLQSELPRDIEYRKDSSYRKDSGRIEGIDPRAARSANACASGASPVGTDAVCLPQPDLGSVSIHTEVNR